MHSNYILATLLLAPLVVWLVLDELARRRRNPQRLPLPPGPRPLPIVGNLFDLPATNETRTYHAWVKKYGEIMSATALGRPMVFLNSAKVANDLFEKRSANYSDRTHLHMINDMMGWDWSFGMMRYGERWREHRKMFHHQFQPSAVTSFYPIQIEQTNTLLRRLLDRPQELLEHLRHNAAATIMAVTYGIPIHDSSDHYIDVAEKALDGLAKAAAPGAFLVDILPFLKYFPEWVPGAGWQKQARSWKRVTYEMRDSPFDHVKSLLDNGNARPSYVTNLLEEFGEVEKNKVSSASSNLGNPNEKVQILKNSAGLAYAAGAESSVSALSSFFLAMLVYPEVQRKAQAELDGVLGTGKDTRLPDFNDRPELPYIDAIVKEVLRWSPVAPLGLPHMATKDNTYNGYFIPAGTAVFGFTWEILHDEETYPEPLEFKPERFILTETQPANPDPDAAFGYGRRICPGRFMANNTLWISIASILATFNIKPAMDSSTGKPEVVKPQFGPGMICHPLPFRCDIVLRTPEVGRLIRQTSEVP